jgi:hypothetical protein
MDDLYVLRVTTVISAMNDITFDGVSYRTSRKLRWYLTCEPKAAIRSPMQENAALRQGMRAFIKIINGGD